MVLSKHRGHHYQHRGDDWRVIEPLIEQVRPMVAVELGTDEGGFAGKLADLLKRWGGTVHTFDIAAVGTRSGASPGSQQGGIERLERDFPNLCCYLTDVLSNGVNPLVEKCVSSTSPSLLYCDNGDKPRELELYAPLLRVGDLLGVHDYATEVDPTFAEDLTRKLGFLPHGHEQMETLRTATYEPMTRFWIKVL